MSELLKLIRARHSTRETFDPGRPIAKRDLAQILEAARWAPTAHNMQNFFIIVIDDKEVLEKVGEVESRVSAAFIRENYRQLSFSKKELQKKRVGILGAGFPKAWRTPGLDANKLARECGPSPLGDTMDGSPTVLIVIHDARKRAPASEGDVLGFISLGCVMENMWLAAQDLGIGFTVMSVFSDEEAEEGLKRILDIPEHMKIAYAVRLGYPVSRPARYPRVRRDVKMFTRYNGFGKKKLE
jgi:nitroreductase